VLLPERVLGAGLAVVELPVLGVVDELVVVLVVELAAFAMAAPPPTIAPVTANVVRRGFRRLMDHLLSPGVVGPRPRAALGGLRTTVTIRPRRLRGVGDR
jgi:hypothetical protein